MVGRGFCDSGNVWAAETRNYEVNTAIWLTFRISNWEIGRKISKETHSRRSANPRIAGSRSHNFDRKRARRKPTHWDRTSRGEGSRERESWMMTLFDSAYRNRLCNYSGQRSELWLNLRGFLPLCMEIRINSFAKRWWSPLISERASELLSLDVLLDQARLPPSGLFVSHCFGSLIFSSFQQMCHFSMIRRASSLDCAAVGSSDDSI
jgi:hypothetical protein